MAKATLEPTSSACPSCHTPEPDEPSLAEKPGSGLSLNDPAFFPVPPPPDDMAVTQCRLVPVAPRLISLHMLCKAQFFPNTPPC